MTREKLTLILLVASVIMLVMISRIQRDQTQQETNQEQQLPTTNQTIAEDKMPDFVRDEFMDGCIKDGFLSTPYCECAYNYLDKKMTNGEFYKFAHEYDSYDEIPLEIYDTFDACIDYLPPSQRDAL